MRLDPEAIRALVHRDRVHRSLYLDPEVFDLEMHKIFGATLGLCRARKPGAEARRLHHHPHW